MSKITEPGFLSLPIAFAGRRVEFRVPGKPATEGGERLILEEDLGSQTGARAGARRSLPSENREESK
jgi:hypothetical protein